MAPPRQPPDLVALLLPPDDPASLVRASLVCKPWRRLLTDPAFHRRYRAIHGAPPPMLGFFYKHYTWGVVSVARFVPTVSPCPVPQSALGYRDWSVIDCRHGRVLFHVSGYSVIKLIVWDPLTGGRHELPVPPIPSYSLYGAAVAVLCAVQGCDHLDCHGGPFLVVLMALDNTETVMQAHMYSSEAGAWNLSAHRDLRYHVLRKPSTLIGDNIYFGLISTTTALLRYDLGKHRLSTINVPALHEYDCGFATMEMENGSLGFAGIIRTTCLGLWSRNADTEVGDGWGLWRIIELAALIPNSYSQACVVGSAEGAGVLVVRTDVGLYTIELMSGHMRKVSEPGYYDAVFPFMSFYIGLR